MNKLVKLQLTQLKENSKSEYLQWASLIKSDIVIICSFCVFYISGSWDRRVAYMNVGDLRDERAEIEEWHTWTLVTYEMNGLR